MITLHACLGSGNCFKPWLVMQQLHQKFNLTLIDVLSGEQKEAAYLTINPLGVVPFLQSDGGANIGESNAMIWFLTEGSHLMPTSAEERAEALQWMFFEQSKLEPFISPARFFTTILPNQRASKALEIIDWQGKAIPGLARLDGHLSKRKFILQSGYSVADIALFGYVHVMEEAGLSLADFPNTARWIKEVEKTDNFVALSQLGLAVGHQERLAG